MSINNEIKTAAEAIAESVRTGEIVHVQLIQSESEELGLLCDDYTDNDDIVEVWGTDNDDNEWRVHNHEAI